VVAKANVVAAIRSDENENARAIIRPGATFHPQYFSRKFAPSSRSKMNQQEDQTKTRQLNICGEKTISVGMAHAAILLQFAGLISKTLAPPSGKRAGERTLVSANLIASAADQRPEEIAVKRQNARREFLPGVEMRPVKFFSLLRPSVKTENGSLRIEGQSGAASALGHETDGRPPHRQTLRREADQA
jgi:hypothetical protein